MQSLESAFQSLIQLGDHQVADLSCVQDTSPTTPVRYPSSSSKVSYSLDSAIFSKERNATLSQEHEQSSLECREHHRDYWQEQARNRGLGQLCCRFSKESEVSHVPQNILVAVRLVASCMQFGGTLSGVRHGRRGRVAAACGWPPQGAEQIGGQGDG